MDFEYFTVGGGFFLYTFFNAVAAIATSQAFRDAVLGASIVGGGWLTLNIAFEQRWNSTGTWLATLAIVLHGFMAPTATVKITDTISHADSTGYTVSNVPFGLAFFGSITNNAGKLMTDLFEQNFADVNAPTLQEHGFLFGTRLLAEATRMEITDSNFSNSFSSYIRNCVYYDILQGRKNIDDLKRSADPFAWIIDDPHEARMFVFTETNGTEVDTDIFTCMHGVNRIVAGMTGAALDAQGRLAAGATTTIRSPRSRAAIQAIVVADLGDFHSYLIGTSRTAEEILRRQITINSLLRGPAEWLGETGNDAAMKDYIDARLQLQTRQSYSSVARQAEKWVPILKATFQCVYIAIFPFAILLMVTPIGGTVIRNYLMGLVWIESWGPLFSILNYMMNSSAQTKMQSVLAATGTTTDISLFAQAGIQTVQDDIAVQAGYLSMSVPFISIALAAGVGRFAYLASSTLAVSQEAVGDTTRESATGNFSVGNTSLGNHSGHNTSMFDTNTSSNWDSGRETAVTESGGTLTENPNSAVAHNQGGALSTLANMPNFHENIAQNLSQGYNKFDQSAASASQGYSDIVSHAQAQNTAFANALASGDHSGFDVSERNSTQFTEAAKTIDSHAEEFAENNNISKQESVRLFAAAQAGDDIPLIGAWKAGGEYDTKSEHAQVVANAEKAVQSEELSEALTLTKDTATNESAGWRGSDTDTYTTTQSANSQQAQEHRETQDVSRQKAEQYNEALQQVESKGVGWNENLSRQWLEFLDNQPTEQGGTDTFANDAAAKDAFLLSNEPEDVAHRRELQGEFEDSIANSFLQGVDPSSLDEAHAGKIAALETNNTSPDGTDGADPHAAIQNPNKGLPGEIGENFNDLQTTYDEKTNTATTAIGNTGVSVRAAFAAAEANHTEEDGGSIVADAAEGGLTRLGDTFESIASITSPPLPYPHPGNLFPEPDNNPSGNQDIDTGAGNDRQPPHPAFTPPSIAPESTTAASGTGDNQEVITPTATPDTASTNLDTNTNLGNDSQSTGGGGGHIASGTGDNQEVITPTATPDTASTNLDTNTNLGNDSQSTGGGGGHIASGAGDNQEVITPTATPDTASTNLDTNTNLGNDSQSTGGGGGHIASGAGDNQEVITPTATPDTASTNLDTNTNLGNDSQSTGGGGGHIASGAGDNQEVITPTATPDTASTNLDTNTNLGNDSQSTGGGGGHIASGAGDNQEVITPTSPDTASATPDDAPANNTTSNLINPETHGSTTGEGPYVPLDTNLGDEGKSSKGKSDASEKDNKDDATATGGHGQETEKPKDWK